MFSLWHLGNALPFLQLLLSQLALSPWTDVILSRPQNNQVIDSSLGTVPPPFNIIPTPKSVFYSLRSVEITELFISFKLLVPGGPSFGCVATLPCGRRNMWKRWTRQIHTNLSIDSLIALLVVFFYKSIFFREKCARNRNGTNVTRRLWGTSCEDMWHRFRILSCVETTCFSWSGTAEGWERGGDGRWRQRDQEWYLRLQVSLQIATIIIIITLITINCITPPS